MMLFAFLFAFSVSALHQGELERIKVDIAHLYDTFKPPPGFFLPSRAMMLAFHDAGTWSSATQDGGAHANQFLDCVANTPCEQADGANLGLGWARDALETVYVKYKTICSRADFWQIAGIVAIAKTGGPSIPFRWGRTDAVSSTPNFPDRLPGSTNDLPKIRTFLGPGRLDLTDKEIVAFLGSHTIGSTHMEISGHRYHWDSTPHVFDNGYFQSMLRDDWVFVNLGNESYQWEATRATPGGGVDKLLMLISDFSLRSSDPASQKNNLSPVNHYVQFYALNEDVWKKDFASTWVKVAEAGQTAILKDVIHSGSRLDLPFDPELRESAPDSHSNAGLIVGVCVGVTIALVIVGAIIFAATRYVRNSQMETV
jgi:cytochrome c peroxidase